MAAIRPEGSGGGEMPKIDNVRGVITKKRLAEFVNEAVEMYPQ